MAVMAIQRLLVDPFELERNRRILDQFSGKSKPEKIRCYLEQPQMVLTSSKNLSQDEKRVLRLENGGKMYKTLAEFDNSPQIHANPG